MELGQHINHYIDPFIQRNIVFPPELLHQMELLVRQYNFEKKKDYLRNTRISPLNVQAQAAVSIIYETWFPNSPEMTDTTADFELRLTLMDMRRVCGSYLTYTLKLSKEAAAAAAAVGALTAVAVIFEPYRARFESQNLINVPPKESGFTERESCLQFLSECTKHLDAVGDEVISARFKVIYYFDTYLTNVEKDRALEFGGKNALLAFLDIFGMDIRIEKFKNFLVQEHSINIDEEEENITAAKNIISRHVGIDAMVTPLSFIKCYMDAALSGISSDELKLLNVVKIERAVFDFLRFFQNESTLPKYFPSKIADYFPSNLAAAAVFVLTRILVPDESEHAFLHMLKFTELAGMQGLTKKKVLVAMFEMRIRGHKFLEKLPPDLRKK